MGRVILYSGYLIGRVSLTKFAQFKMHCIPVIHDKGGSKKKVYPFGIFLGLKRGIG